jgi:transposase
MVSRSPNLRACVENPNVNLAVKQSIHYNLKPVDKPDKIQKHNLSCCSNCAEDFRQQAELGLHKRQVFDIPPPSLEVTEHQTQVKE